MTFWDWASQGDNLICLVMTVLGGLAVIVAIIKGVEL